MAWSRGSPPGVGQQMELPLSMKKFKTTRRPRQRLLVFARVPEYGRVKTRIAAELDHERALELYSAMLEDLLASVGHSSETIDVEILWTGSENIDGAEVLRIFGDRPLAMQAGRDLGDRLTIAFAERILFHKADKVIAIGTDDPTLSRELIETAFELLTSCDWVIGPAIDGGYYLIGCRGDTFHPSVFEEIDWGSETVLESTTSHIRKRAATLARLPERNDLDLVTDLRSYCESPSEGRLSSVLREWGWLS
ncbi:MAG TPA: TIGR04282 family arsenosugar biosynthesis glycosyltransferase [Thermoanaerobaculia bacterium]|nr:TIGR04282 family arsenosugar biosynthesis glycosyltransferase [Thermoanaerobaculia bacterium]